MYYPSDLCVRVFFGLMQKRTKQKTEKEIRANPVKICEKGNKVLEIRLGWTFLDKKDMEEHMAGDGGGLLVEM